MLQELCMTKAFERLRFPPDPSPVLLIPFINVLSGLIFGTTRDTIPGAGQTFRHMLIFVGDKRYILYCIFAPILNTNT